VAEVSSAYDYLFKARGNQLVEQDRNERASIDFRKDFGPIGKRCLQARAEAAG